MRINIQIDWPHGKGQRVATIDCSCIATGSFATFVVPPELVDATIALYLAQVPKPKLLDN